MNSSRRLLLFVAVCAVALVFFLFRLWPPVATLIQGVFVPIGRVLSLGGRSLSGQGGENDQCIPPDRLRELESRVAALAVANAKLRALEEEVQSLRAQTKFLSTSGYRSLGAHVISRFFTPKESLVLIDRGSVDGVELGHAVIVDEGIYIGKVIRLQERVATVELVRDPHARVVLSLPGGNEPVGVLEGSPNGALLLSLIPNSEAVSLNQLLVTGSLNEKIPPNLPVGIVRFIDGKQTDPFFRATIDSLFPLERLQFVSVMIPGSER